MKEGLFLILFLIGLTSLCDTIRETFLKSSINSVAGLSPHSIKELPAFILKVIRIPWVWVSFLFSIMSLVIWLLVLSQADLNFAFSLDSMHYIFIAIASQFILKEKVGPARWLGTALIVGGIVLVTLS